MFLESEHGHINDAKLAKLLPWTERTEFAMTVIGTIRGHSKRTEHFKKLCYLVTGAPGGENIYELQVPKSVQQTNKGAY